MHKINTCECTRIIIPALFMDLYAKMTTYGTRLHLVTCTCILLILYGNFVSYFQVKVLLKRHLKDHLLAKLY